MKMHSNKIGQKQTVGQVRPIRSQHCSGHGVLNVLEYFTHVLCSSNQLAAARGLISIKHSFRPLTYTWQPIGPLGHRGSLLVARDSEQSVAPVKTIRSDPLVPWPPFTWYIHDTFSTLLPVYLGSCQQLYVSLPGSWNLEIITNTWATICFWSYLRLA